MISQSSIERRIRRLEQVMRPEGRSFVIHCRDGEEDSPRVDELIATIEREYGSIHPVRDQLTIIRIFGEDNIVSNEVIVRPLVG